jgi:hypothetical protein
MFNRRRKLLSEEQKIGKLSAEIDKETRELLQVFWEKHKEERNEEIEAKNMFEHVENLTKGINNARKTLSNANQKESAETLNRLYKEAKIFRHFLKKLEKDEKIDKRFERMVTDITNKSDKHLKSLEHELKEINKTVFG